MAGRVASCELRVAGRRPSCLRKAFTLTEIMFAVMILGVGLIMVAAIFPVAIQQTQANLQDTAGVTIARNATAVFPFLAKQVFDFSTQPATGYDKVHPFYDWGASGPQPGPAGTHPESQQWTLLKGNLISQADARYAWVPVGWRRPLVRDAAGNVALPATPRDYVEVYLLAVRARNGGTYAANDLESIGGYQPNLQAKPAMVSLEYSGPGTNTITFAYKAGDANTYGFAAAAEGAFVLIADATPDTLNGKYYRLGAQRDTAVVPSGYDDAIAFDLAPDYDMFDALENTTNAQALIVGRGYADPANPANGYDGPAQDLLLYTPLVVMNPAP